MPANDHNRDIVAEINKKYFSSAKDEVNIMADLGNCARRLIFVLTIGRIMALAGERYEPNKIIEAKETRSDGKISRQTTFNYSDPYNYDSLREIHSIMFDGLMISLRNMFYSMNTSNSAGSFIARIANVDSLKKLNEYHRLNQILFGYDIGFISKKELEHGEKKLNGRIIKLPERSGNTSFSIMSDEEKYVLYYDIDSSKAQRLAKKFYKDNYFIDKQKQNNIVDIKEYERFYFHKDKWPDNKRWAIQTKVKKFHGVPVNFNYYENLCQADIDKIINKLEELVEIMNLYYRSCVSIFPNKGMQIHCNVYASLPKMVRDICDSFAIKKPDDFDSKITQYIEKKIPKTIGAMMLAK